MNESQLLLVTVLQSTSLTDCGTNIFAVVGSDVGIGLSKVVRTTEWNRNDVGIVRDGDIDDLASVGNVGKEISVEVFAANLNLTRGKVLNMCASPIVAGGVIRCKATSHWHVVSRSE